MEINVTALIKEAMKEKNDKKLMAFRLLKAAFVNAEKVDGNKIDELKQIKIINKMISDCKNSADIYKKANRAEQAAEELSQAVILQQLLPKLPSKDEVNNVVIDIIKTIFDDKHKVSMADMKTVKPLVLEKLPLASGQDIASSLKKASEG